MRERTLRFILDSIFCMDAMSPEFKKANDILLRIVKMNDRTDGLPHTRLVEINKAFKANDAKAARAAFDKLKPLIAKGTTELENGLTEARSKLSEASQKAEQSKSVFTSAKGAVALFDKFRKAIDGVKAKPTSVSKLSAYADKLKAYGDFSKRIAQMTQMVAAKKDVSKQVDMLAAACDKGKAKADKERAKAEKDYGAAKDRVSVFKEMEKIRTKKVHEFAEEEAEIRKLGREIPLENTPELRKAKSELKAYLEKIEELARNTKKDYETEVAKVRKVRGFRGQANEAFNSLIDSALNKFREKTKDWPRDKYERVYERIKDTLDVAKGSVKQGMLQSAIEFIDLVSGAFGEMKPLLVRPKNFVNKIIHQWDESRNKTYGGEFTFNEAKAMQDNPIAGIADICRFRKKVESKLYRLLLGVGLDPNIFVSRLRSGYYTLPT